MTPTQRGASVAVFSAGRVLLVRRGRPPFKDYWSLPGGRIDDDESTEQTARRELREETGLTAGRLIFVRQHLARWPGTNRAAHIISVFACDDFSGETKAGDDAAEAAWFTYAEIQRLRVTPGLAGVTESARAKLDT